MQRHTVSHLLNRLKPVETCFDKLIGGSSESVKCHLSFKALCCILSDYAEPQSTRLYVTMGQDSAAAGLPQDKDAGRRRGMQTIDPSLQRGFSSSPITPADTFAYEGPLSQTLKNLKRLSISGAAASIFGSPVLVYNTAEAMPLAAQASICFTIASFGLFTTGLLHWFTSPYVHRLDFNRDTGQGEVKTLSILARPQQTKFSEAELCYPDTMRPQVTFEVRGKFFYLDANAFADKELLERLSPADPNAVEAAPLNDPNSKQ